jgi:uncharacterized damage-inducible protein DinB
MNKDDIQLLYEYDRWANHRVLQAASTLSAEQFTRDLGGAFHSLRDTLVHIVAGEWAWLEYWNEPVPDDAFHADLDARLGVIFNPNAFPNVSAVQLKWAEVEKAQIEFVNRTTNDALERMVPFRTSRVSLGLLMQHLANHSTYHRGQIALMMRQLNAEPLATNFHEFLLEGHGAAATH